MMKTAYVNKNSGLTNTRKINPNYIILMILLLGGVLIGTLAFCFMKKEDITNLSFITQLFIKNKADLPFIKSLANTFFSSGIIVLLCFILGFSAITQPVELVVPVFKGLGLGASIAYIYVMYGVKGFLISFLLIMPNAVISSICIIVAVRECIKMSNKFTLYALSYAENVEVKPEIKLYILKFVILFVVIGLSSLIDSLLAFIFAGLLL